MRIVLGIGGGIAAYKAALISRLLTESGHDVVAIPTESALRFIGAPTLEALTGHPVHTSVFAEVETVNHVRQAEQADMVLIAPATADLLARLAAGRADDLLTATVLTATCPVVIAPAMHTQMWENPATQRNLEILRGYGHHLIEPATGRLTGGDSGPGRLPDPSTIVEQALAFCPPSTAESVPADGAFSGEPEQSLPSTAVSPLSGLRLVISAGGTREAIDPVRYLGNRSSGLQGIAIARAARQAGAQVTLVCAHLEVPLPQEQEGMRVVQVSSACQLQEEMRRQIAQEQPEIVIMAAAVADFRPAEYAESKIKKDPGTEEAPALTLVRNPDILRGLIQDRDRAEAPLLIVGFAAETGSSGHSVAQLGREKLLRKGADLLVVNEVGAEKVFGREETDAEILVRHPDGDIHSVPVSGTKEQLAHVLLQQIAHRLPERTR